jgi:hypothetical protein
MFANTAAYTKITVNRRLLYRGLAFTARLPILPLEGNRFIRDRAHLLTDYTILFIRPGNTAFPIQESFSDHLVTLVLQGQVRNRLDRTGLAAGPAGIITLTKPGN